MCIYMYIYMYTQIYICRYMEMYICIDIQLTFMFRSVHAGTSISKDEQIMCLYCPPVSLDNLKLSPPAPETATLPRCLGGGCAAGRGMRRAPRPWRLQTAFAQQSLGSRTSGFSLGCLEFESTTIWVGFQSAQEERFRCGNSTERLRQPRRQVRDFRNQGCRPALRNGRGRATAAAAWGLKGHLQPPT